jgi:bis(5'-nucleosyl)-tetraphosphatase (symmetrical)
MATYIVGDIQGCYDPLQRLLEKIAFDPAADPLQRLLEKIAFDPAADQLWCPGDLVNRGKQSLETLRLLESLGGSFAMTLGNHDLYLLREHWRFPDGGSANHEIDAILHAPDRERLTGWLQQQPMARWSSEYELLMVHAGVIPQWTLEQTLSCASEIETVLRSSKSARFFSKMSKNWVRRWDDELSGWKRRRLISNILTQLRFCDENGKILSSASGPPGSQPLPYKPWFKHKHRQTRDITIAFGHWAALGFYARKKVLCVDSGCVWGGRLTAVRLEDRQAFQVPGVFHPRRVSWSVQ